MSGTTGEATTEKKDGALWHEEGMLQEVIGIVADRLRILEKRLTPILRPHGPETPEGGAKEPKEVLPDLVERLRAGKAAVQAIEVKLASLLERLEI